ncbi:MAG: M48 family metalloprotease [Chitinophagaceae bacterium]|jgi:hypothetical protein|nr:M48 family metalloprotease [Chitinophagaceae bacterium]
MFKKPLHVIGFIAGLLFLGNSTAQKTNPYIFPQLSHVAYAKEKDSLKKTWECPNLFSSKVTQKKYKEIWETRVEFVTNALEGKNFVKEPEIYNYILSIVNEIAVGNPSLMVGNHLLLIDRSSSINAYAMGGNILAVNAGLIAFANTREELAFVIAHELAHNILHHADNSMKEKAAWLTSDEYKKSLEDVLTSKYERYSKLKKVFEGYSFNRSKHSRYFESDADSLAIVLLKNSRIAFSADFFLRLDSSDMHYKLPLKNAVKDYFTNYNLSFEDSWTQKKSKGLSSRNYSFKDTSSLQDSLKTHPECLERFAKTKALSDVGMQGHPIPASIKNKANKIIIWNLFDNLQLTGCLYNIMLEKDKGNKDEWYDFMFHNVIAGLYYADRKLMRFNSIGVIPKEYISKDYYQLQTMLEQIPKDQLQKYYEDMQKTAFWSNATEDAKALKSLIAILNSDTEKAEKEYNNAAQNYINNHAESMYCEFAEHFKKK